MLPSGPYTYIPSSPANECRNFLVQMITPYALNNIGYRYYFVYMALCFAFTVTVYFYYPETMGMSLEKLEDFFQQDISVLKTVGLSKKLARMPNTGGPEELRAQLEELGAKP